ncbi:hypothetical protein X975_00450, partial [Stegodyphus mimosarum]
MESINFQVKFALDGILVKGKKSIQTENDFHTGLSALEILMLTTYV